MKDICHALQAIGQPQATDWYAAQSRQQPFYFDAGLQSWVATSAASVAEVLASPLCGVRPAGQQTPAALQGTALGDYFALILRQRDDAGHLPQKTALLAALQAVDEAQLQQACARAWQAETAGAATLDGRQLDQLALAYPLRVMAGLLGLEETRLHEYGAQVDALLAGLAAGPNPAQRQAGSLAVQALQQQLAAVAAGQSTLLDALRRIWPEAAGWQANGVALLQQTREATAALLGHLVLLLAQQPALREHLRQAPALRAAALAECLRWRSPLQNTRRVVQADGLLCGQAVMAGQNILLLLAAANLDARCHPAPTAFELARPQRHEHGFGLGAHRCPGSRLALALAATALDGLLSLDLPWPALAAGHHYRMSINASWPQFSLPGETA